MSRGVCTNLPAACSKAAARTPLPCDDQDSRCPECGAALLQVAEGAGAAVPGKSLAGQLVLPVLALATAVGVGWSWVHSTDGPATSVAARAPAAVVTAQGASSSGIDVEPPAAGLPEVISLHGVDVLGESLGLGLVEAYLAREGYTDIHRVPASGTAPLMVAARRPAGTRVEVRLGPGARDDDATGLSLRRASALGADLQPADVPLGLDALAVIVHPDSPLRQVSLTQLRDLFAGRVTDGRRVGGVAGAVTLHVRDEASDAWGQVRQQVLGHGELKAAVQRHATDAELVQAVAADPHAVGLLPSSAAGAAKVVAVADSSGSLWLPTPEAVAAERYPLTHRLVLRTGAQVTALTLQLARFLGEADAQTRLRTRGLVAAVPLYLPRTATAPVMPGSGLQMPKDYAQLTTGAVQLAGRIGFAAESAELDAAAKGDIERMARQLKERLGSATVSVMALGLANDPGGYCANRALSQQRAAEVARALTEQGVNVRISRGVGRMAPATAYAAPDAMLDRRVEIWVADRVVPQPWPFKCVPGKGHAPTAATAAPAPV